MKNAIAGASCMIASSICILSGAIYLHAFSGAKADCAEFVFLAALPFILGVWLFVRMQKDKP